MNVLYELIQSKNDEKKATTNSAFSERSEDKKKEKSDNRNKRTSVEHIDTDISKKVHGKKWPENYCSSIKISVCFVCARFI